MLASYFTMTQLVLIIVGKKLRATLPVHHQEIDMDVLAAQM